MIIHMVYFGVGVIVGIFICLLIISLLIEHRGK
ncbi:uncharacterized membrane-anchored protein YhcB (DUF1043 family) [Sporomusaceae bacterium BoRhaA]|jgi:hypothetical protein|nr:uncharacterized membrane-anchored protein YhcB (DUF1043 family) [Pelorhabdus rhamnosifermentans]